MKRFALLTATLMLGGAAIAQDTGYDDPATPDTAVSSDTTIQADTTTNTEATTTDADTDTTTSSTTDVMSDTDAAAESTTTTTDTTATDTMTTTTSTDATTGTTTTTTTTGVGGPYEPAPAPVASMPTASAIPAQTSKGGYPPCDGSESADSCIQLYERGVKSETNLAMNNSLPGGDTTMTASAETTMPSGQLSADATMSSTATSSAEPATGVGGPYEPVAGTTSKKDYPPCSGAESDDSCIQLYERGVTGADD